MTTHSSILAWRTSWSEEPGRLQSMGLQSWTQLKQLNMHASALHFCAFYFYYYYICSTSDHQTLDPGGWGPWTSYQPARN